MRAYHRQTFRPDLTTIVVIGKVTPDQALAIVQSRFGGWRASGPKPRTDPKPAPQNKPAAIRVSDESRVQDEVKLAQVLGLDAEASRLLSAPDREHVLSGAFYATRLYRDLREKTGLVYSVDSVMQVGKTRALFEIAYASDPENVSKARARIDGNLRDLQTSPISGEELRQARALLVRRVPLSHASMENIALELLKLAHDDLPLDEPRMAAKRYLEITAEDIQAGVPEWIRPGISCR